MMNREESINNAIEYYSDRLLDMSINESEGTALHKGHIETFIRSVFKFQLEINLLKIEKSIRIPIPLHSLDERRFYYTQCFRLNVLDEYTPNSFVLIYPDSLFRSKTVKQTETVIKELFMSFGTKETEELINLYISRYRIKDSTKMGSFYRDILTQIMIEDNGLNYSLHIDLIPPTGEYNAD